MSRYVGPIVVNTMVSAHFVNHWVNKALLLGNQSVVVYDN